MASIEDKFIAELEVFRGEANASLQFHYALSALRIRLSEDKKFRMSMNEASLTWRTVMGGLQTSLFIVLGRVFDHKAKHNVYKVLSLAEHGCDEIFSKEALARRKRKLSANADEWLEGYLKEVYVPKEEDFVRLRKLVEKRNAIYDNRYRRIRNKVFAHKEATAPADVEKLFKKTNLRELELLCVFLKKLHLTFQELTINGKKPILRPSTYSIREIRRTKKIDSYVSLEPHERVALEVFHKLKS